MEIKDTLTSASYIVGFIGVAGGVFSFFRYGNYKTTVQLQNDSIKALEDNNKILRDELERTKAAHAESQKAIANLSGQVHTLSTLQLNKISDTLVAMRGLLESSAATLVVDTKNAAKAVSEVKTDLATA